MHDTHTVRDIMGQEFVGVSESDTVLAAVELMLSEEVDSVVVLRGREPVGTMTARDALALLVGDDDPSETPVSAVMTEPMPTIEAGASLTVAADTLISEAAEWALVVDDGGLSGVLTERDLMTASTLTPGEDVDETPVTNGGEQLFVDGRTEYESEYSNQSICEVCGKLAGELSNVNGQLVCADCRDV